MRRILSVVCLIMLSNSFALQAQVSLSWTSRYSQPAQDSARALAVDSAGNAYVTGMTFVGSETQAPDIVTIKYNSTGALVWTATWGSAGVIEHSTDIEIDAAGNVYVYGVEYGTNAPVLVLVKYNSSGAEQWVRRFGTSGSYYPAQATLDSSGNIYLTGTASPGSLSEFLTLKYDSSGNLLWSRSYSPPGSVVAGDFMGDAIVNSSGQVYVVGANYEQSSASTFTLKYDTDGTLLWSATHPSSLYAQRIALDGSENVYVGASGRAGGASEFLVLKYEPGGTLLWSGTYHGPSVFDDNLSDIAVDSAGNVYLVGTSTGAASHDVVTVKFAADGVRQWVSRYNNETADSSDSARGIAVDSEGSVYVAGYTASGSSQHDYLALKFDTDGNRKWVFLHDEAGGPDFLYDFALGPEETIFLTGSSHFIQTNPDIVTVKLEQQPVGATPVIRARPQDAEVIAGRGGVTFSVLVDSPTPVTYQWRFNGRDIPGATQQSYAIPFPTHSEAGEYSVRVSNAAGVTATPEARLTVRQPPTVVVFALVTNVVEGRTIVFDGFASGDQPIRYQWRFNDRDLVGQTNQQLRLIAVTTNNSGFYTLIVRNPWGDSISNPVELNVFPRSAIDRWTWLSPLPQGNELTAMAYGNGRYVAVGDEGTVIVSTNGRDWSVHSADYGSFSSIAFGDGLFVAAAQGLIYTSQDGIAWTNRTPTLPYQVSRVVFGAGRFVATGNALLSSDDGISWIEHSTNSAFGSAPALTYGNNVFMIHSWNGLLISSNGIDWVQTPAGPSFPAIAAGNGVFVAHNYYTLLRSTNGLEWETVHTLTDVYLDGLSFVNGQFHALGGVLLTSPDGRTWSQRIGPPVTGMQLLSAAGVQGQTIVVGDEGVIFESNDGANFQQLGGGTRNNLRALIYANNRFTITGNDGLIWRSDDGLTFTPVPSPSTNNLRAIAYGNGNYIIVGEAGAILTSPDGLAWQRLNLVTDGLYGIKFANGHFTVVGESGRVLVTTNARDWTLTWANTGERLQGVAYGAGRYVATGQRGYHAVSTNAVDWQAGRNAAMGYLESIVYTNGLFVAVGSNGRIFTTPDGVQWTYRPSGSGQELESIIYVQGQFIAAGDRGTLMTSTNGTNWVEHRFLTRNSFRQIIYARGALWGVGNNEMIVKSGQLQPYVTLESGPLSGRLVRVVAEPGQVVDLQASDDLAAWETLSSGPASPDGTFTHIDSAQRPMRFYRVGP